MPPIPSPCFISHAYNEGLVDAAVAALPKDVRAIVFPEIRVGPAEFVSDALIAALQEAKSILVADGPASRQSYWVAFETFFAMRNGKAVYRFDGTATGIVRDTRVRKDPPIFASYQRRNRYVVDPICDWLREERGFNVWKDTESLVPGDAFVQQIRGAMTNILADGGYVIAFMTTEAATSPSVSKELEFALSRYEGQVFLACLGDKGAVIPRDIAAVLSRYQEEGWLIELGGAESAADFSKVNLNRLDDLMVRVLYLVHKRQGL